MINGPALALKYSNRVKATESDKHTSLQWFRINGGHKKFYDRSIWTFPKIFECCKSY